METIQTKIDGYDFSMPHSNSKWVHARLESFFDFDGEGTPKEPETNAWIADFEPGSVFWDIGANIGNFSIWCCLKLNNNCTVHAFEPLAENVKFLLDIAELNDFPILIHHVCIGNRNGRAYFISRFVETGASGGQVVSYKWFKTLQKLLKSEPRALDIKERHRADPMVCVKGDTIASNMPYYYSKRLLLRRFVSKYYRLKPTGWPDYIKIDTDGNELDILKGMPNALRHCKGLLVEINKKRNQALRLIEKAGLIPDERYNSLKTREKDYNMIFKRK